MPIDKGDAGRDRPPDDWERIGLEQAARDKAQRKRDAEHDPSEEFEKAARKLPEGYGKERPSRTVDQDTIAEMVELWGQDAVDRRIESGKLVLEGSEVPAAGVERAELDAPVERDQGSEAPSIPAEQVREVLDHLPAREEGRPTTAMVYDATGYVGSEQSGGVDDGRSETAAAWLDEGGWKRSARRVETHAEAKIVVDMIEGRLPQNVTVVINNEVCREVNPRIASCEGFIRDSLPQGYSLRVYENNENERYFEGTR